MIDADGEIPLVASAAVRAHRPWTSTVAPVPASRVAVCKPMPSLLPVTRYILPAKLMAVCACSTENVPAGQGVRLHPSNRADVHTHTVPACAASVSIDETQAPFACAVTSAMRASL